MTDEGTDSSKDVGAVGVIVAEARGVKDGEIDGAVAIGDAVKLWFDERGGRLLCASPRYSSRSSSRYCRWFRMASAQPRRRPASTASASADTREKRDDSCP